MSVDRATPAQGLRWIIAYKLLKAPVMLGLAGLLFARPQDTLRWAEELASVLVSGGWLLHRIGLWLAPHLGESLLMGARWLAAADGITTALEATLLLSGRTWAEWVVAVSVASLLPFEVLSLLHRFHWGKLALLAVNLAVAVFLIQRRLRHAETGSRDLVP
jgi:hypothetical protein